jgi:hypothetical protein
MLDFEEFRLVAANACVAVTATKNVATATTTTIVITLPATNCYCVAFTKAGNPAILK